jgi:hypothetical protein
MHLERVSRDCESGGRSTLMPIINPVVGRLGGRVIVGDIGTGTEA